MAGKNKVKEPVSLDLSNSQLGGQTPGAHSTLVPHQKCLSCLLETIILQREKKCMNSLAYLLWQQYNKRLHVLYSTISAHYPEESEGP